MPSLANKAIDLAVIDLIAVNKEITLVVDESHSLGVLGNGCGIFLLSTIKISNEKSWLLHWESNRNNRWRYCV
jgi:7-keto-8-aminopelargonate synthetase-like enzyme